MATFNADATLGALEIGVLISTLLFGALTVQTYVYYSTFPEDSRLLKGLVAAVWLCELGHSVCVTHAIYILTITQYGQPQKLAKTPTSLSISVLFSGFVGPLVQAFFAQRVLWFSKRLTIPVVCWVLSALRFLGSVTAMAEAVRMVTLKGYTSKWTWLLTAMLSIGACVDVILAASLCFYLKKRRSSNFDRTMRLVDRLVIWTIETGLITSVAAVVILICFLTMPNNFIWIAIFMFLAKLFSNSLMATLNGRAELRKLDMKGLSCNSSVQGSDGRPIPQCIPVSIEMSTTTRVDTDGKVNADSAVG